MAYITSYIINGDMIKLQEEMIKSLGKGNKSTNENITCLYCTFVKHLSTIDQKTSQAAKNQKNFMKYLGRVQNYFSDENICEEKLKVKIQHHC